MVKRTFGVLGVLSLVLMMAGASMAFLPGCPLPGGCFGGGEEMCAKPLYVPVPVPDVVQKTIVKKWEVKIVGPCPPPGPPACGASKTAEDSCGMLMSLAQAIPSPFDYLFAGPDAVYGCLGGGNGGTPCGTPFGAGLPRFFGAAATTPFTFFGGLW